MQHPGEPIPDGRFEITALKSNTKPMTYLGVTFARPVLVLVFRAGGIVG
jgi:hypothetical protein